MARRDLPIGLRRLFERNVFREGHDALEERIESLEPIEIKLGQLGRAHLSAPDQRRELDDRQESKLFRRVRPANHRRLDRRRLIPLDSRRRPRRHREKRQSRGDIVTDFDLPQLGERRKALLNGPSRARPLVLGQLQSSDPLCLLDHLLGDRPGLSGLSRQRPPKSQTAGPDNGQPSQNRRREGRSCPSSSGFATESPPLLG